MIGYSDFSSFGGRERASPLGSLRGLASGTRGSGYDPNQPRVPKGNPDGGQWTEDGRGDGGSYDDGRGQVDYYDDRPIRYASKDPPEKLPTRRGPSPPTPRLPGGGGGGLRGLLVRLGLQLIGRYLEENKRPDLFGDGGNNVTASGRPRDGKTTAAITWVDDRAIFGTNSGFHAYTPADRSAATNLREILVREHTDIMDTSNIGGIPNDALFHAETTALLRAAKMNGGTLAGRTLEIVVNGRTCPSCIDVLPLVVQKLGNPTVFITDFKGVRYMIRDDKILRVHE